MNKLTHLDELCTKQLVEHPKCFYLFIFIQVSNLKFVPQNPKIGSLTPYN